MTPERDPPQGTAEDTSAPETYTDQVAGLADLLDDDPVTDPAEDEGHDDAAKGDPEDPDAIIAEDADAEDGEDGPQEDYSGGRFAADDAKVRMADGRVISVADLKSHADTRVKEMQRGLTEKTTAIAEERKHFEAKRQEVDQQAQSLSDTLQYLDWYAENYLPKAPPEPVDPRSDPHGWQIYQAEKQKWDEERQLRAYFRQQMQGLSQQKQQEAEQARREHVRTEVEQLAAKDPLFRDDAKGTAWFTRAKALGGEYYGFNPQEIAGAIQDHRLVMVLRDAFRYRHIKAKAPAVKEEVRRPAIVPGGKRPDPNARVSQDRKARSEQLRKNPTLENGARALMDFDL